MGPCDDAVRRAAMASSPVGRKYDTPFDRDSAHEMLARRAEQAARGAEGYEDRGHDTRDEAGDRYNRARRYQPPGRIETRDEDEPRSRSRTTTTRSTRTTRSSRSDTAVEAFTKSMARSIGTRAGSAIVRGVLGTLFRGR